MGELKPCAHCEGKAVMFSCDGSGHYYAWLGTERLHGERLDHFLVKCEKCGIRTKAYLTKRGAFNAWNRRANEPNRKTDSD